MTAARRFAVIGDPIAHSKSPLMHAAAYRALGLPHHYEAIRVKSTDLPEVIAALRAGQYDGLNVTVPHKQDVLAHVDVVAKGASLAGAANTLVREASGKIVAHNTDTLALAHEMRALAPKTSWSGERALVLGTGGAARAAIVALATELGVARIEVRGRSRVDALVSEMSSKLRAVGCVTELSSEPLVPGGSREQDLRLIVQATSAGMTGADPGDSVASSVAWPELPASAVALDVVYAPRETPFLRAAKARGLRSANGLGMLARQGACAFELWLSLPAPYEAMLAAISSA